MTKEEKATRSVVAACNDWRHRIDDCLSAGSMTATESYRAARAMADAFLAANQWDVAMAELESAWEILISPVSPRDPGL